MKILHILNGEGTAHHFTLPGNRLVWNEALACGPTTYEVATPEFYTIRQEFFTQQYNHLPLREPIPTDSYQKLVIQELNQLKAASDYQEITLWFEFDWFCQVNLMAVLSWLYQQQLGLDRIYLVCIDAHPAVEDFRGLGQLAPEHFAPLFAQRKKLSEANIAFADKVWAAYCGQDLLALVDLIQHHTPAGFPYLKTAFGYFQQLFPDQQSGLNLIERQMLEMIQPHSLPNKHRWVGRMLRESTPHLGFGDLQYYDSMQRMGALWQENEQLQLTDLGKQVVNRQQNFLTVQPQSFALGGVKNTDYRWHSTKGKLVANE
ncbi:hypothetical protein [uncultured Microscilla sp.]|uniref:hypothetical protein n=1 Tax=uncultured Microscilla sp. TaxID=432653 RepID=UPI0026358176|nr:hypothetical protein [uncultured Microscilla sp.]